MSSTMATLIPEAGAQIGAYEVVREVGRGGMATILEAVHKETGDVRAIKLMLPGGYTEEVVQRFRLEFDILARLDHPGIMRVHATDELDGRPYIVMELLDGRESLVLSLSPGKNFLPGTLRARARFWSPWPKRWSMHGQGLVHRDVTLEHHGVDRWKHSIDGFWCGQRAGSRPHKCG